MHLLVWPIISCCIYVTEQIVWFILPPYMKKIWLGDSFNQKILSSFVELIEFENKLSFTEKRWNAACHSYIFNIFCQILQLHITVLIFSWFEWNMYIFWEIISDNNYYGSKCKEKSMFCSPRTANITWGEAKGNISGWGATKFLSWS